MFSVTASTSSGKETNLNDYKALMTAAALATLRGDADAVKRTEAALAKLKDKRHRKTESPAALQTSTCGCAQAGAQQ
jgi:hypothetical protein